jgi:TIR domain
VTYNQLTLIRCNPWGALAYGDMGFAMSSGTVLVVGFGEEKARVASVINLAVMLSAADKPVTLMSISSDTFSFDLLLLEGDVPRLREYRSKPGLLNLVDEYTAALLAQEQLKPASQRVLTYGSLTLTAPSEYLAPLDYGGKPLLALRGEPRAFSEQKPLTGEEPPLIWEDLWRDWAGAAFFRHLIDDLASVSSKVFIDCNGEIDLPAAERMAALVDLVLLVVDYNSEGAKSRAYHYGRQLRENNSGREIEILAVPVAVRSDGHPDLLAALREQFQGQFGEFSPPDLNQFWFVNTEIPYVQYYELDNRLAILEPIERMNVGLWMAYSNLADLVTTRLGRLIRGPRERNLTVDFLDARQRVRWDIFISYSSADAEQGIALRDFLRKHQLRSFLAQEDMAISVGLDQWRTAIARVLDRSRMLIVLVSQNSMHSAEVRYELDQFETTTRLIVPIVIENDAEAAELLSRYHAILWDTMTQTLDDLDTLMPLVYGGLAT